MRMICTKSGCADAKLHGNACCKRCGFEQHEAKKREDIPLTLCADGLRRKLIPRKPTSQHGEGGQEMCPKNE